MLLKVIFVVLISWLEEAFLHTDCIFLCSKDIIYHSAHFDPSNWFFHLKLHLSCLSCKI